MTYLDDDRNRYVHATRVYNIQKIDIGRWRLYIMKNADYEKGNGRKTTRKHVKANMDQT